MMENVFKDESDQKKKEFSGRSVENGNPISAPLKSLQELLNWIPNDPNDAGQLFCVSTVPKYQKKIRKDSRKTMVVHDMKGGYLEDRFVQETSCKTFPYLHCYWSVVDIFVYFSHHLVSIPPVTWVNAAHQNGVAVLGNFITENKDICCQFINDDDDLILEKVARKLADIAKFYNFDGWFINIENEVTSVPALKRFLSKLTKYVHESIPGGQVVWYDSVVLNGQVDYQNEVNNKNSWALDHVDSMMTNYWWNEENLKRTFNLDVLADQKQRVFFGVDVFGRGSFGGGGYETYIALEAIKRFDFSAAIFAPGWIYENCSRSEEDFKSKNLRFWLSLAPYLSEYNIETPRGFHTSFFNGLCSSSTPNRFQLGSQQLLPLTSFWSGNDDTSSRRLLNVFMRVKRYLDVDIISSNSLQLTANVIDDHNSEKKIYLKNEWEDFGFKVLCRGVSGQFRLVSSRPFSFTGFDMTRDSLKILQSICVSADDVIEVQPPHKKLDLTDEEWKLDVDCWKFNCTLNWDSSSYDIWVSQDDCQLAHVGHSNSPYYRVVNLRVTRICQKVQFKVVCGEKTSTKAIKCVAFEI